MKQIVLCNKCRKEFEVAGLLDNGQPVEYVLLCPYADCGEIMQITWPRDSSLSVVAVPSLATSGRADIA